MDSQKLHLRERLVLCTLWNDCDFGMISKQLK